MDDPLFPLLLVLRYMHILGAIMLMGGAIFMRFALAPTVLTLEGSSRGEFQDRVRARWSMFVRLAAGLLLVSGLANMMLFTKSRYDLDPVPLLGVNYGMFVGIKFILAIPIFLIAELLVGRSATAKKLQEKGAFWMNINLALALVMVLMGGLMKFVQRDYKPQPVAARIEAAATSQESANQILPFRAAAK